MKTSIYRGDTRESKALFKVMCNGEESLRKKSTRATSNRSPQCKTKEEEIRRKNHLAMIGGHSDQGTHPPMSPSYQSSFNTCPPPVCPPFCIVRLMHFHPCINLSLVVSLLSSFQKNLKLGKGVLLVLARAGCGFVRDYGLFCGGCGIGSTLV